MNGYFEELKRRKVFRVAIAYVVGAWILTQIADATFEPLNLPAWSTSLVLWLLILGFPVALFLAWALEVTPDGIKRTVPRRAMIDWMKHDSDLDNVRDHPRFKTLLESFEPTGHS